MNWSARIRSRQTYSVVSLMEFTFFRRNSPSVRFRSEALGHVGRVAGDLPVVFRPGERRYHRDREDECQRVPLSPRAARVGNRFQHTQQAGDTHIFSAFIPGSAGIRT